MEDRRIIIEKKIECIIGIIFLVPPFFGVFAFILNLVNIDLLCNLTSHWTSHYDFYEGNGGGMSAAPLYLAIMALAGASLTKDKLRYFINDKKEEKPTQETTNE